MEIKHPKKADIPMLRDLWQDAFGDSEQFLDMFFDTAFNSNRALCITDNNSLCAALYWFDCTHQGQRIAYIYAVATAKAHRGKGLCRTLTDHTQNILTQQGYAGAILVPAQAGLFDMYKKLGYKICSYIDEFEVIAQDGTVSFKELNKEEYASLRKKLLPHGAVIQEKESLDFLCTYTKFYAGDDFVFTAYMEHNVLIVRELLGSSDKAAKITNTLGCPKGIFRTIGGTKPFAMYCQFKSFSAPSYFGLAFD